MMRKVCLLHAGALAACMILRRTESSFASTAAGGMRRSSRISVTSCERSAWAWVAPGVRAGSTTRPSFLKMRRRTMRIVVRPARLGGSACAF